VPPETVATAVRKAVAEYPDKRLVAHFMQPHYPFIGEIGQRIEQGGISPTGQGSTVNDSDIWTKMKFGLTDVTTDEVWAAYRENLDIVLDEVRVLVDDLTNRTVITADHGNMLGERSRPLPAPVWGHPRQIESPELLEVPWLSLDGEPRNVVASAPESRTRLDSQTVNDRLSDLGYK